MNGLEALKHLIKYMELYREEMGDGIDYKTEKDKEAIKVLKQDIQFSKLFKKALDGEDFGYISLNPTFLVLDGDISVSKKEHNLIEKYWED